MENRFSLLDQIRSIAQLGLRYATNPYDVERYEKLLELACNEYAELSGSKQDILIEKFKRELGHITPKVGVGGVVFSSDGKILLERRADDGTWGIIGGWCDAGETPQEALQREFLEETKLHVNVNEMIDVFTRKPGDFGNPHTSYHLLYVCDIQDGTIGKSFESMEIEYYHISEVQTWHTDHYEMAKRAYEFMNRKKS